MNLRKVLAAGTAFAMLAASGIAYAGNTADILQTGDSNSGNIDQSGGDSNVSKFKQVGDDNLVTVLQTGNSNSAGRNNSSSPLYGRIWQTGDDNHIEITQTGNQNGIVQHKGASSNGNPYDDGNFYQEGDFNWAKITQNGGGGQSNGIDEINQLASPAATSQTNKLTILQDKVAAGSYGFGGSDYNYVWNFISTVNQTHTGGLANVMELTQTGGIYGRENKIARADQNGSDNDAKITQTGFLNFTSFTQIGTGNDATIVLQGKRNGVSVASAYPPRTLGAGSYGSGSFASLVSGVTQGSAAQDGNGDALTYNVLGDDNKFGFSQSGGNNNGITGSATGNSNQVAIVQSGNSNSVGFNQTGSANDLGISQTGDGNMATVNVAGDSNAIGATQTATSTGINSLTVDIFGNSNGGTGLFTGFASTLSLTSGVISQTNGGSGNNSITYKVGSLGSPSSSNLFAFSQNGSGNMIDGSTSGGDANQVAVLQVGDSNSATFTQIGGGNNIAISQ